MSFSDGFSDGFDTQTAQPPVLPDFGDWMTASIVGFIEWNPTDIEITRRQRVETEAAGWVWEDVGDLPIQTVRLWPVIGRPAPVVRSDGASLLPEWNIVGTLDVDIIDGDKFLDKDNRLLEVIFARYDQYAVRAQAIEHRDAL